MDLESLMSLDRLALWGLGTFLVVVPGLLSRTCCKSAQMVRAQGEQCKLPDADAQELQSSKPSTSGDPRHVA